MLSHLIGGPSGHSSSFIITNTHKVHKPLSSGTCRSVQNHETDSVLLHDMFWDTCVLKFLGRVCKGTDHCHYKVRTGQHWKIGNLYLPEVKSKGTSQGLVTLHLAASYSIYMIIFLVLSFLPFQSVWALSDSSICSSVWCLSCPFKWVHFPCKYIEECWIFLPGTKHSCFFLLPVCAVYD